MGLPRPEGLAEAQPDVLKKPRLGIPLGDPPIEFGEVLEEIRKKTLMEGFEHRIGISGHIMVGANGCSLKQVIRQNIRNDPGGTSGADDNPCSLECEKVAVDLVRAQAEKRGRGRIERSGTLVDRLNCCEQMEKFLLRFPSDGKLPRTLAGEFIEDSVLERFMVSQ
jgi:hypothetical protein